jgi:hypothetical protein
MAEQFLQPVAVGWFAEDLYHYDAQTGLYLRRSREWLRSLVQHFLVQNLGSNNVDAGYVDQVCRAVRSAVYLDESRQPPFWIDTGEPADVIVAANGIVQLDELAASGGIRCAPHSTRLFAVSGVAFDFDATAACRR